VAGFILLGSLGQKNTVFLAVVINILLAIFIFISKRFNVPKPLSESNITPIENEHNKSSKRNRKVALLATFISGLFILGLQVIWIRVFKIYLTNTSYTFALITSLVIFGLFVGSWIYKRRGDKIDNNIKVLINALILMGLFALLGMYVLIKLPELYLDYLACIS